jgi:hypothetical protein
MKTSAVPIPEKCPTEYSLRSIPMSWVQRCGFGVDIGESSCYQTYMHDVFVSLPQVLFPNLVSVSTYFLIYFVLGIENVSILSPSTFTQLKSDL